MTVRLRTGSAPCPVRMTWDRRDASVPCMSSSEPEQRAKHHASEAERLLAGRLGIITNLVKAGVHATLAVYYSNEAQRPS
jgi:hypothetical protein